MLEVVDLTCSGSSWAQDRNGGFAEEEDFEMF